MSQLSINRCASSIVKERAWAVALLMMPFVVPAFAQLAGESLQVHGFLTQGYAISDRNNYLTMATSRGTAQMTDGGLNLVWRVNGKLRVGVQAYDRYIGDLGKGQASIDWALLDYHYRDWLGFRVGKVKTPLGLFNDAQDQEFLYTWALLPQSVYPLDLRETTHAHIGGDIYGFLDLRRKGLISYQTYAGKLASDYRSGLLYGIEDSGFRNVVYSSRITGYDLRWTSLHGGLTAGVSQSFSQSGFEANFVTAPVHGTYLFRQTGVYVEFARGPVRVDTEYRDGKALTRASGLPAAYEQSGQKSPGWYAAISYRLNRWLESGVYRSEFRCSPLFNPPEVLTGPGANHIFDTALTMRFDLNPHWNMKIEGHFMDGFGSILSARGFYPRYHSNGITPTTNLLVLRTGFTF